MGWWWWLIQSYSAPWPDYPHIYFLQFFSWLLQYDEMQVRSTYPLYLEAVNQYFKELIPRIAKYQVSWKKRGEFCGCSFRDRSQTLVRGGLMQKGGPLKFLTLVRGGGALKKNYTDFPLKIEFTCFSMGLTCNFRGKKGGPWNFFAVWSEPPKIFAINIFCIRPPLTSVCERSLFHALSVVDLATPFKTYTPPCGRLFKRIPQGECKFSNAHTFYVIFTFRFITEGLCNLFRSAN